MNDLEEGGQGEEVDGIYAAKAPQKIKCASAFPAKRRGRNETGGPRLP
jgi:hypothetical protein